LNLYTYVQNNPLIYSDPTGHMMKEDSRFHGTSVYDELWHLTQMWNAAKGDAEMQNQIHETAQFLRSEADSGANYNIIRINTFIPLDSISMPTVGTFGGDGAKRGFDYNSLAVRTSQYIVVDTDTGDMSAANYVGKSHKLGKNPAEGRASNKNMQVETIVQNGKVFVYAKASVGNPLVKIAPPLDYYVYINTSDGRTAGVSNTYPAYEIYMSTNGSAYKSLYQYMPTDGAFSLFNFAGTQEINNTK
jgi:hypothetical protein